MFRKAFRKLTKVVSKPKSAPEPRAEPREKAPSPSKTSPRKILTAEGWKRLMMKKHRKS